MVIEEHENFVRSVLGNDIGRISLTVSGDSWNGWERSVHPFDEESDYDPDSELLNQVWHSFHERDIRLFQGHCIDNSHGYFCILAVPRMPVLKVPQYANTGSHNQWENSDSSVERVQTTLESIYAQAPFEILYADSAGLDAVFLESISKQQSEAIAKQIFSIAFESYADIDDGRGSPAKKIRKEGKFKLWWD